MTVTYTANVATCRGFGCFLKLLFRWRGSIYKLVWLDLLCFLFIYYMLNIIYRFALDGDQKVIFEGITKYCAAYSDQIPLSFVLGFYVSIVMTRWWNQYTSIPWPDSLAVFVSASIHGEDGKKETGRLMRRTIMRYVCLALTMVLTNVSPRVKKRFPTLQHLVEAGLMVDNEKCVMEQFNTQFTNYSKHWMPIVWAASIVTKARKQGLIRDDFAVKTIIDELNNFRAKTGTLIMYDTISVPLVYTQVVTLAVYTFFMTAVMAQQWTENKPLSSDEHESYFNMIDMYFPVFTTLQFFFYMGWLKVAESLINPFGEDDDDFEVSWMIDRNLQVSYMIVDEMHHNHPNLVRDQYWDQVFPDSLPYTVEANAFREKHPLPSTANIEIPKSSMTNVKLDEMVGKSQYTSVNYKFPDQTEEVNNDDAISGIHFTTGRSYPGRNSKGSSASLASMNTGSGSIPRTNSVVSTFKRLFGRQDSGQPMTSGGGGLSPQPLTPDVAQPIRLPGSASTNSLMGAKYPSMKITHQIIEEVDEQMTITSLRNAAANDQRPTAASVFAGQPVSQPVAVPSGSNHSSRDDGDGNYMRTQSFVNNAQESGNNGGTAVYLSSSAPVPTIRVGMSGGGSSSTGAQRNSGGGGDGSNRASLVLDSDSEAFDFNIEDLDQPSTPSTTVTGSTGYRTANPSSSAASSSTGTVRMGPEEHFEKLRQSREKERQNRFLARSISTQQQSAGSPQTADIIVNSTGELAPFDFISVRIASAADDIAASRKSTKL